MGGFKLRLGIRAKLFILTFILASMMVIGGTGAVFSTYLVNRSHEKQNKELLGELQRLGELKTSLFQYFNTANDFLLFPNSQRLVEVQKTYQELKNLLTNARKLAHSSEETQQYDEIAAILNKSQNLLEKNATNPNFEQTQNAMNMLQTSARNIMHHLNKLEDTAKQEDNKAREKLLKIFKIAAGAVGGSTVLAAILAMIIGYFITNPIIVAIQKLRETVHKVEEGCLNCTVDIKQADELGELATDLNNMVEKLNSLISTISTELENLYGISDQVASVAEQVSRGATEQAAQVQGATTAVDEIVQGIQEAANQAANAARVSEETMAQAQTGAKTVDQLSASMEKINREIKRLGSNISRITEFLAVIEDIAEQTSLLALNAAIEAARAGEHGRGFAVVAENVRKLAERSAKSTKEIEQLVFEIQKSSQETFAAINDGNEMVGKNKDAFNQILNAVNSVVAMIEEIAKHGNEVAERANRTMEMINSISAVIQETAATTEELAATSHTLVETSNKIKSQVAYFNTK
ncbi:methyl-accepting chemotaxis protein [Carboxydothermus hydrogenoformans]|uniref:Methyl-accepting chemotaxis protein n=1 Tax=Carboxydothermus hydrogenoformans (strain ATCC BAA-161 / DSM 6008 / Z-2901) TaxID=246194 RepID=Q3ADH2_CARHZ|nr:methyl-accepting chemotaxis protein [Carboxydothermus hydrogenoformans]ABB14986.1 methyl-accepting chemotaxis protein [Carboxydothermus hydrogenoformans Z-2901]